MWRRLLVAGGVDLRRLHAIIQASMGWEDGHLHVFSAGGVQYGDAEPELEFTDERTATLADLVTGAATTITYTYDGRYPTCLAGAGACPPEDCGGPGGYAQLRQVLADPDNPDHEDMLGWLGLADATEFAPERFDVDHANWALARIR